MNLARPLDQDPEDIDPPPDRETPTQPGLAGYIAESKGLATDQVPSSLWSGIDIDTMRPHVLRVASACLTGKQLDVFTRWLSGKGIVEIADELGLSHQAVSHHLIGRAERNGTRHGGAVKKLREQLLDDHDFLLDVALSKASRTIPDPGAVVREWFKGIRIATLHQFVPRCVLLVLFYIADATQKLTFEDAHRHLPPAAVASAMPILKALGYVETDGVTIKIRKTPISEHAHEVAHG